MQLGLERSRNLGFRPPNVERCEFFQRLVGGDDDQPTRIPYWRRPMRIVGAVV
jgi:hypothetical protein